MEKKKTPPQKNSHAPTNYHWHMLTQKTNNNPKALAHADIHFVWVVNLILIFKGTWMLLMRSCIHASRFIKTPILYSTSRKLSKTQNRLKYMDSAHDN